MALQESAEMYLEAIYILTTQQESFRSVDVANFTGYTKPSVSRAVNLLKKKGYIDIDTKGIITLTDKGYITAKDIYTKHCVLTELLTKIGVSPETANDDACKIEHVISDETFEKIQELLNNLK